MATGYLFTDTPPDVGGYDPLMREARARYGAKESAHAMYLPMSRSLLHAVMMGRGSHLIVCDTNTPVQTNSDTMLVKVNDVVLVSSDVSSDLSQFLAEWHGEGETFIDTEAPQAWNAIWRSVVEQIAGAQQSYVASMADFYKDHHPRDLRKTPTFRMDDETSDQIRAMTYQRASDILRWIIQA